jgi:CheY-like chemotaxis protein
MSFMTGVDLIGLTVQELKHRLMDHKKGSPAELSPTRHFDSIETCLQTIRNTHAFMLMAINRTIDYTKASQGLKLVPRNETIELKECIQLTLNCMENIQGRVQIRLNSIPKNICSHVITDRQWLLENVLCLLSNAVKYSTDGFVTVQVSLEDQLVKPWIVRSPIVSSASDELHNKNATSSSCLDHHRALLRALEANESPKLQQFIRIEVIDTGIGMSEEAMALLFNPLKQSQRLSGGTGLGLYALAKRVEALHGSSGVMTRRDGQQGSLFWFLIPYNPDELSAQQQNGTQVFPYSLPQSQSDFPVVPHVESVDSFTTISDEKPTVPPALSILVVDDSPAIVKMVCLILNRLGHCTNIAENGAIAVQMVEEAVNVSFDVVLMDLQMPVMGGLEATSRIRKWDKDHDISRAIIGMSANSDHETSLSALEAGVDVFLPKPFNLDRIRSALDFCTGTQPIAAFK